MRDCLFFFKEGPNGSGWGNAKLVDGGKKMQGTLGKN